MRLIFDMINKNIEEVPEELPAWLIPGSKAKLVKERVERKQKENADLPKKEPPKVDWYMSPQDLTQYQKILDSCGTATDGSFTFAALSIPLKSKFFNIGSSDLSKAWDLINPKNLASIDKDPALLFIHCLRQRNDIGAIIPFELPTALAETVNKQQIKYDLNATQSSSTRATAAPVEKKTESSQQKQPTTVSNTNPDTEIKALETKLHNLDSKLTDSSKKSTDLSSIPSEKLDLIREQYEGLLEYLLNQASSPANNSPVDVRVVTEDLDNIEQQVNGLETYLQNKKQELQSLNEEIQSYSH